MVNAKAEKPRHASHASGSEGLPQADWLGPTLLRGTRVYGHRRTLLCGGRSVLRDRTHLTTFHNVGSKIGDCTKVARKNPSQPIHPGKSGELSRRSTWGAYHRSKKPTASGMTSSVPATTLTVC